MTAPAVGVAGHPGPIVPPAGLPRLLAALGPDPSPVDLSGHLGRWGLPPLRSGHRAAELTKELERAGLRGRGGAWFPTAVKWRAVSARRLRRAVVVVNGAEAEPASAKDRLLLGRAPHLVLDGASLAGRAVGAGRVIAYVPAPLVGAVTAAVAERRAYGLDPVEIEVVTAGTTFVAGEESAVVAHLNGGAGGLPTFTGLRPVYERGVAGAPTLVQNVETLAHAALIARFGAAWFRTLGTSESPGTALLTVLEPGGGRAITETPLGASLGSVLAGTGIEAASAGAVLMGGFGGTWMAGPDALSVAVCEEALRARGATLGAGVVGVLPAGACPLAETAHIVAYMETQGAGQCGPCVKGLPALASVLAALAWKPAAQPRVVERIGMLCDQIEGRGACHHPDGVVRLVRSALRAFPGHVDSHLVHGPCHAVEGGPLLPVPDAGHRPAWSA